MIRLGRSTAIRGRRAAADVDEDEMITATELANYRLHPGEDAEHFEKLKPYDKNGDKVADGENGRGHDQRPFRASRGFRASLSPSPMRLSDNTVRRMATPGMKLSHHAVRITVRAAPIM